MKTLQEALKKDSAKGIDLEEVVAAVMHELNINRMTSTDASTQLFAVDRWIEIRKHKDNLT